MSTQHVNLRADHPLTELVEQSIERFRQNAEKGLTSNADKLAEKLNKATSLQSGQLKISIGTEDNGPYGEG